MQRAPRNTADSTIRVVTWNVQHQGLAGRLPAVVARLRTMAPDVALLQEVMPESREVLVAQLGLLHTHSAFVPYVRGSSKRYGCMIASAWPLRPAPSGWCADSMSL